MRRYISFMCSAYVTHVCLYKHVLHVAELWRTGAEIKCLYCMTDQNGMVEHPLR